MVGQLLWRGMLAGVVAGLFATCFALLAAENPRSNAPLLSKAPPRGRSSRKTAPGC